MELALRKGYDVSAKDIAPLVKQKMVEEYRALLGSAPDDILSDFIDK